MGLFFGSKSVHNVTLYNAKCESSIFSNLASTLHFPENILLLSTTQTTNSITGGITLHHFLDTLLSKIRVKAALNNSKQVLCVLLFVCLDTSIKPANGSPHGFFYTRPS